MYVMLLHVHLAWSQKGQRLMAYISGASPKIQSWSFLAGFLQTIVLKQGNTQCSFCGSKGSRIATSNQSQYSTCNRNQGYLNVYEKKGREQGKQCGMYIYDNEL